MVSADGRPVRASCGLQLGADLSLDEARAQTRAASARMVIVCSGQDVERYVNRGLASWLRECRKARIALGAVCTGAHLLAKAGILDKRRCTIPWENLAAFSERFSNVQPSPRIFAVDDEIYTCAGGSSPLEMMLEIIGREEGASTAAAICQLAIVASLRDGAERQRLHAAARYRQSDFAGAGLSGNGGRSRRLQRRSPSRSQEKPHRIRLSPPENISHRLCGSRLFAGRSCMPSPFCSTLESGIGQRRKSSN
ncbi:AraC family transcriptional regulator [Shinella sp. S4-D37]|uniref:AraC family transcriptional regulator n=1 Tax=Shinella sp. S4-D37 TaxID=3161999 RepID=UPI0034656E8C